MTIFSKHLVSLGAVRHSLYATLLNLSALCTALLLGLLANRQRSAVSCLKIYVRGFTFLPNRAQSGLNPALVNCMRAVYSCVLAGHEYAEYNDGKCQSFIR